MKTNNWQVYLDGKPVPDADMWPAIATVLDFDLDHENGGPSIIAICPDDKTAGLITTLLNGATR